MRKNNQHFKLLFFTINLHFVTSDQVSTYRKLNLLLTSIIYSVQSSFPYNCKKDSNRPNLLDTPLFLKRNNPQTFKSRSCKNAFLQRACYWYDLLPWIIFITCYNRKTLLFKLIVTLRLLLPPYCCFLWSQYFERNPHFMCYLHNNNSMLIPNTKPNSKPLWKHAFKTQFLHFYQIACIKGEQRWRAHDRLHSLIIQMLFRLLRWQWIQNIEQKN